MNTLPKILCVFLILCTISMNFLQVSLGNGVESPRSSFRIFPADTPPGVNTCPVPQSSCGSECSRRCSNTQYKKACLTYCNKCCNACLCVPPGSYGNKECCACYINWKTKRGGPKCP